MSSKYICTALFGSLILLNTGCPIPPQPRYFDCRFTISVRRQPNSGEVAGARGIWVKPEDPVSSNLPVGTGYWIEAEDTHVPQGNWFFYVVSLIAPRLDAESNSVVAGIRLMMTPRNGAKRLSGLSAELGVLRMVTQTNFRPNIGIIASKQELDVSDFVKAADMTLSASDWGADCGSSPPTVGSVKKLRCEAKPPPIKQDGKRPGDTGESLCGITKEKNDVDVAQLWHGDFMVVR